MSRFAKLILISTLLFFKLENSYAQSDSLTVFFKVQGPRYEKYKIYYGNDLMVETPRGGLFLTSFKIPFQPGWIKDPRIYFEVQKKGFFRLGYKYVGIGLFYDPNFQYLVLYRDPARKNRIPVTSYWTNKKPTIIWE